MEFQLKESSNPSGGGVLSVPSAAPSTIDSIGGSVNSSSESPSTTSYPSAIPSTVDGIGGSAANDTMKILPTVGASSVPSANPSAIDGGGGGASKDAIAILTSAGASLAPSAASSAIDDSGGSVSNDTSIFITIPASASPSLTITQTSTTPPPTYATLPIQPINIVVLTDVHSWVMGHGSHDETFNVDYGDVLSFYQRLKELVDGFDLDEGDRPSTPDLYLVMNGDFIHGTALGADPPRFLPGIVERMPYDVVTLGDHELTDPDSLAMLREPGGLVDAWGDRLVASNLPLGQNFRLLRGNQGTVLVLGFLYEMGDEAVIAVEMVKEVLREAWFTSLFADSPSNATVDGQASRPAFDVILVMAHMDVGHELVSLLHATLRQYVGPNMTIQFITGHTHVRAYSSLDEYASSFEAGRYLETVGYVSFHPGVGNSSEHVFIDASRRSLAQSLGMGADDRDDFSTEDGAELSGYIQRTLDNFGATKIVGCADSRYRADGRLDRTDSLSRLYLERVMPGTYLRHAGNEKGSHHSHGKKREEDVFVQYLDWSSVRYDLFPGVVTVNDVYGAVPQDDAVVTITRSVRGDDLTEILQQMGEDNATDAVGVAMGTSGPSSQANFPSSLLPPYGVENGSMYKLHMLSRDSAAVQDVMIKLNVASRLTSRIVAQSMRNLWIEFVEREWPYDGNGCQCLQEETGCQRSTNYSVTATAPSDGSAGSEFETGSWIANPPIHSPGNKTHASSAPTSKGGHHAPEPKSGHRIWKGGKDTSSMSVFWAAIFAVSAFIFIMLRLRRRASAREIDGNNDLQLQESAAGGAYGAPAGAYSSPAMPSRATYV